MSDTDTFESHFSISVGNSPSHHLSWILDEKRAFRKTLVHTVVRRTVVAPSLHGMRWFHGQGSQTADPCCTDREPCSWLEAQVTQSWVIFGTAPERSVIFAS
jgi:hypothetical protein